MFNAKQTRAVAAGLLVASVAAMAIVAGAAFAGASGNALSAMSTVLSTGFAAVAVVVSLGLAEPGRAGSEDASGGRKGENRHAPISIRPDGTESRIDVDVSTGHVHVVMGGVIFSMVFPADRIEVVGASAPGSADRH